MTYNIELMTRIRDQITAHPETHDQSNWGRSTPCGVAYDVIGWAAVLSGATLDWGIEDEDEGDPRILVLTPLIRWEGQTQYIQAHAQERLGLTKQESVDLNVMTNERALAFLNEKIDAAQGT